MTVSTNTTLSSLNLTSSLGNQRQFEALAGELALAEYILARIDAHAWQYQTMINHQLHAGGTVMFFLLYFLAIHQLKEGNTVFWLSDNADNWAFMTALNAPAWQKQVLEQVWQRLAECFEEDFVVKLCEEFVVTANALTGQTSAEMNQAVTTYTKTLAQKIGVLGLPSHYAQQSEKLILLAFRLCYVAFRQNLDCLASLRTYLLDTPFFMTMHHKNAVPLVLSDIKAGNVNPRMAIWLYRSYLAEKGLADQLNRLLNHKNPSSPPIFEKAGLNAQQEQAVASALSHAFTIITGGPGTGKTFTVARLVLALLAKNPKLGLALSAPTGKAAQRMQESLQSAVGTTTIKLPEAMTIHRLLGMGMDGIPRYHADNPLPYEVIVVDEASMLGVELGTKLFSAIKTKCRLVLLGDNYQLSAVEAGRVLGDLCSLEGLTQHHVHLTESRRFADDSGIGKLAMLINGATLTDNKTFEKTTLDDILQCFHQHHELAWLPACKDDYQPLIAPYQPYFEACQVLFHRTPSKLELAKLFEILNGYRILCVGHQGKAGDEAINQKLALAHLNHNKKQRYHYLPTWYHGRVVMITKNHYNLGLFNGDMGICIKERGGFLVYFDGKPAPISVALLPEESVTTAYAITVHKSQGSEFGHIAICLDDTQPRLLSRELLYTAITRAKEQVSLYADEKTVLLCIASPTLRNTGLELLYPPQNDLVDNSPQNQ